MELPFDIYTSTAKAYEGDRPILNCPNCGAPIDGDKCMHCGTYFVDYGCLDTEKPFWLKIKRDGQTILIPVKFIKFEETSETTFYCDNVAYTSIGDNRTITLEFQILNR